MSGQTLVWIVVVAAALVVLFALVVWLRTRGRRQREQDLRGTFGSEYDRTVEEAGSRADAERELLRRQDRHDEIKPHALSEQSRTRYMRAWESVQAAFVDRPRTAVDEADELIRAVSTERGYPLTTYDEMAADLSVEQLPDDRSVPKGP